MIRGALVGLIVVSMIIFIGNYDTIHNQKIEQGRTVIRMACITIFLVSLCALIGSYL